MKSNWTPGPWTWRCYGRSADMPERLQFAVRSQTETVEDSRRVAIVEAGDNRDEEAEANARLISLAPELAEALYEALHTAGRSPIPSGDLTLNETWFKKIRGLLAKLEGGGK